MFSPTGDQFLHQYHCPPPPPPPPPLMTTMEKSWKPTVELAPNCPRCASPNTKFCYYNNYSLSQPRYFCKGCRRYWTKGGSLRNVPVGGGCRKNRRGKSVRLPHHRERPSSTSSNSQDSGGERSESSNGDSSSAAQHIDMAVVFAKFLNQKPESGGRDDDLLELDTETVRVEEEVIVPDDPEDQGIEQVVLGNDIREFGLDSLLGGDHHRDEAVLEQDVFWSDIHDETANFSWQLQELEAFPVSDDIDDQLRFSTDSMNDNWSSLDLYSGFEVFSRS